MCGRGLHGLLWGTGSAGLCRPADDDRANALWYAVAARAADVVAIDDEKVKAPRAWVVYVGDRADVDVAGAQGAGLKAILIESPYRHEGLGNVVPDAIIGELQDLILALERLQGEP